MFLPFAVEARQKFLDMGCNVYPSARESERDVLWLDLSLIHISEPTRRTPISYAVFCLKKKKD